MLLLRGGVSSFYLKQVAQESVKRVEGVEFVQLTAADIVRHRLVQEIVDAYEADSRD